MTGYIQVASIGGAKGSGKEPGKVTPGNQDTGKTTIKDTNGIRADGNNGNFN